MVCRVGVALLQGDYKKAVQLIMEPRDGEREESAEARRLYLQTGALRPAFNRRSILVTDALSRIGFVASWMYLFHDFYDSGMLGCKPQNKAAMINDACTPLATCSKYDVHIAPSTL